MTEFMFAVDDINAAKKVIKKIDAKFNANENAKKILYRQIKNIDDNLFHCEIVFPFPDIRIVAWFSLAINAIIFYFFRHLWIFGVSLVLFAIAYRIKYMTSSKYYFKMLVKGMRKNGYTGDIRRIGK